MKFLSMIFLALFAVSSSSFADSQKAVDSLFQAMDMKGTLLKMAPQSTAVAIQSAPQLAPHKEALDKFYKTVFSDQELINEFKAMYVKAFTAKELDSIAGFYKTPTGKKTLVLLPKLFQEGMMVSQSFVQKKTPLLEKLIEQSKKGREKK